MRSFRIEAPEPVPVPVPVGTATDALVSALVTAGWMLAVAIPAYAVGRVVVVPATARVVRSRNPHNPTIVDATRTYVTVLVLVVAAMLGLVAGGYGRTLASSTVVIAAVTLAVGIAGQDLIGSLVSGLFLVADPEFNVGDWIEWPGGEGRVERVDFRSTRVGTVANAVVTVPNTVLTADAVVRPYARGHVRARETVPVAYGDDLAGATRELAVAVATVEGVADATAPRAWIETLGDDNVTLTVEYRIDDPTVSRVKHVRATVRDRAVDALQSIGATPGPPAGRELSGAVTTGDFE
ncbi:mechanosensitive ion channel family protein [Halobaculum rubrum]|uniref:mechanosensitive ion channel family protein n=1 Tax=Halobaculum rubrum TaxID=2872158 RepID=UPI001CA3E32E|nr:mechanosensitive ion channel domain-containing protein [Halobaculum rubrum]QZY00297.1 mechanosensitive ion channel family protein [Halobaculum rubrum]